MLEQDRVATQRRVEDPDVKQPLDRHQDDGDGDHRGAENLDDGGGVVGPDEQGQSKPRHPGSPHAVDRDDEIEARHDGGKSSDKRPQGRGDDIGVGKGRAERRVEGPASIDTSIDHGPDHEQAADVEDIPTGQVDLRESQILGADHDGDQKIPQHGRNSGDQEQKDHEHAVHGEETVVGIRLHQIAGRCRQLDADRNRHESADQKEHTDGDQIENGDAFVILGQQPGLHAVLDVEIVQPLGCRSGSRRAHDSSLGFSSVASSTGSVARDLM